MRRLVLGTTLGLLVGCGTPSSVEQFSKAEWGANPPHQPCRACPDPERSARLAEWLKRPELVIQLQPLVSRYESQLAMAKSTAAVDAILDELNEEATLYAETH